MLHKRIATIKSSGTALSILDQFLVSASNFLSSIIVARAVSPEEFGTYSLAFTGLILLSGVQNALITFPLKIFGVRARLDNSTAYYDTQFTIQCVFGLVSASSVSLAVYCLTPSSPILIFSFAGCLFFTQLQEIARAMKLASLSLSSLVTMDALTHGIRLSLLAISSFLMLLSPSVALTQIAIGSAAGAALGLRQIRISHALKVSRQVIATATMNWRYGRWLLVETLVYSISTNGYFYYTALMLRQELVAVLTAVSTIVGVVNPFLAGIHNIAVPIIRQQLIDNGYAAWRTTLLKVSGTLVLLMLLLLALVSTFAESILSHIYGLFYAEYAYIVPIVSLGYLLMAGNTIFSIAFRTANLPEVGAIVKAVSAAISLSLFYPLLMTWGVAGAAVGMAVGPAVWAVGYASYLLAGSLSCENVTNKLNTMYLTKDLYGMADIPEVKDKKRSPLLGFGIRDYLQSMRKQSRLFRFRA